MEREIASLLEVRARYRADPAATALIDRCIDLCRRADAVQDPQDAAGLQGEIDGLLAQIIARRDGEG